MTNRERFIRTLKCEPIGGQVPTFELVFFLTMEAFGRIHPSQRHYGQWNQMSKTEQNLHIKDQADLYIKTAEKYGHSALFIHPNPGGFEWTQRLLEAMDAPVPALESYTPEALETPVYGVYFGQAALPMKAEEMVILQNTRLSQCRVFDYITGEYTDVYNMDKLSSPDLYDVFLSGGQPLLTIENPNAQTDRELVIFRDSFGSAIAPLLVSDYSKVTLVDLRYIPADQLGYYLSFENQDVLFLYSTLILNSGRSLK
jgi:hypothetical protein